MPADEAFFDLSDEVDDFEFPYPPTSIWLIFSLEFPIIYESERYVLVTQPYYGDYTSLINFGEGIWYPPFSAFPIDVGYFPPRTLGDVRRRVDKVAEEKFDPEFVNEIAYNLGLGEPQYERIGERPVDEYKLSPRGHNIYKSFRLYRYRCWHRGTAGKRNLTDPEGIKGLYYIPVSDALSPVSHPNLGPHTLRYFSRVVATHFSRVKAAYAADKSVDKFTIVEDADLVNEERGYLLAFDISGFGRAELATRLRGFHPRESGDAIAFSFRKALSECFLKFFRRLNVLQFVTLGDGFIAGVPVRTIASEDQFRLELSEAIKEMCVTLDGINALIKNSGEVLGLRVCIVKGDYRFGKIAGISSLRPEFDGDLLIDAARLDVAMKETLAPEERKGGLALASYSDRNIDLDILENTQALPIECDVKEKNVQGVLRHAFIRDVV